MWQRERKRDTQGEREVEEEEEGRGQCVIADSCGRGSCRDACYHLFLWEIKCGKNSWDKRGAGDDSLWRIPTPAILNFYLTPLDSLYSLHILRALGTCLQNDSFSERKDRRQFFVKDHNFTGATAFYLSRVMYCSQCSDHMFSLMSGR